MLAAIAGDAAGHGGARLNPATGDVALPLLSPPLDGRAHSLALPDPASPDGWAHSLGPMQFLATTFARWAVLAPGRPAGATASPHNAWDAAYTAARLLCAGRASLADLGRALWAYNPSGAWAATVRAKAAAYGLGRPAPRFAPPGGGLVGAGVPR